MSISVLCPQTILILLGHTLVELIKVTWENVVQNINPK